MRAARLVVDTGIHAFGWSRERALAYLNEHVPMPREFLASEVDRYVVIPGQALAYPLTLTSRLITGQLTMNPLGPNGAPAGKPVARPLLTCCSAASK